MDFWRCYPFSLYVWYLISYCKALTVSVFASGLKVTYSLKVWLYEVMVIKIFHCMEKMIQTKFNLLTNKISKVSLFWRCSKWNGWNWNGNRENDRGTLLQEYYLQLGNSQHRTLVSSSTRFLKVPRQKRGWHWEE